jgi:hypothetical protein
MALGVGIGLPFGRTLTPATRIAKDIIARVIADGGTAFINTSELANAIKSLGNLDCATCKAKYILERVADEGGTAFITRAELANEITNL